MGTNFPYDVAAAYLIVREAGGVVTAADGSPLDRLPVVGSGAGFHVSVVATADAERHARIIAELDDGMARLASWLALSAGCPSHSRRKDNRPRHPPREAPRRSGTNARDSVLCGVGARVRGGTRCIDVLLVLIALISIGSTAFAVAAPPASALPPCDRHRDVPDASGRKRVGIAWAHDRRCAGRNEDQLHRPARAGGPGPTASRHGDHADGHARRGRAPCRARASMSQCPGPGTRASPRTSWALTRSAPSR